MPSPWVRTLVAVRRSPSSIDSVVVGIENSPDFFNLMA